MESSDIINKKINLLKHLYHFHETGKCIYKEKITMDNFHNKYKIEKGKCKIAEAVVKNRFEIIVNI